MKIKFIFLFILIIQNISAQRNTVKDFAVTDKKALQIPDSLTSTTKNISNYIKANFATNKEKVRAIFIWVASNIQYDVENMFAINFYETQADKISKALATRKGICENYAALFNDICLKCDIKSYVIEGYTKQDGFTDYIPHAWCTAFVDNSWFMFDPTWGSGFINSGKFYKKINNAYFDALPSMLIKTHMPFDYLWQFLNYPVSNQEFYEGKTAQNTAKPFYNFVDSLNAYEAED
ncbi:MAG: transglutaminase domain-containing protein, partial [Parafilimonas sp.]